MFFFGLVVICVQLVWQIGFRKTEKLTKSDISAKYLTERYTCVNYIIHDYPTFFNKIFENQQFIYNEDSLYVQIVHYRLAGGLRNGEG